MRSRSMRSISSPCKPAARPHRSAAPASPTTPSSPAATSSTAPSSTSSATPCSTPGATSPRCPRPPALRKSRASTRTPTAVPWAVPSSRTSSSSSAATKGYHYTKISNTPQYITIPTTAERHGNFTDVLGTVTPATSRTPQPAALWFAPPSRDLHEWRSHLQCHPLRRRSPPSRKYLAERASCPHQSFHLQ